MTYALFRSESDHPVAPQVRPAAQLAGQLVAESEHAVTVRVAEGTWTFARADLLGIETCKIPTDSGHTEPVRPVLVQIRPGATADFTQRLRIDVTERPMTLPARPTPARGDEELQRLTENWARTLHLRTRPGVGGATLTCCQTRSSARSDDGTACDSLD